MAEEASTAPPVEAPAPVAAAPTEPTPTANTNGATSDISKEVEVKAGEQATTEVTAPNGVETAEVAEAPPAAADASASQASDSKKEKRKSTAGVPEHKIKKLNKKKSMPTLHLECKPGDFYWAKLKGYPPWPSVVCDEQMLPESLLASRPISTTRPDGTIRDDFKEGGKNAKERTFPVMFLSTNEFTWIINTALEPLDPEECKTLPKSKMIKSLQDAWKVASENHTLDYFKGILKQWQEEEAKFEAEQQALDELRAKEAEERAAREAVEAESAATEEAQAAKKKAKSRKSKGADGDVEMTDADGQKSAKKRKKDAESDGEGKPKKTPKVTKLNAPKTPNGEASTKKSKKKVVQAPKAEEEVKEAQLTEAEVREQRERAILYLRHRLQKGFLSRDQAPKEDEMEGMAVFFTQLESYENLEASIIRTTKIHKVLKGIVKLSSIPKDEEYQFKKRSSNLLDIWNRRMAADGDVAPTSATEMKAPALPAVEAKEESAAPETNGVSAATEPVKAEEETKEGAPKQEAVEAKAEEAEAKLDAKVEGVADVKDEAPAVEPVESKETVVTETKDVAMTDAAPAESTAKDETVKDEPMTSDAPAAEAA